MRALLSYACNTVLRTSFGLPVAHYRWCVRSHSSGGTWSHTGRNTGRNTGRKRDVILHRKEEEGTDIRHFWSHVWMRGGHEPYINWFPFEKTSSFRQNKWVNTWRHKGQLNPEARVLIATITSACFTNCIYSLHRQVDLLFLKNQHLIWYLIVMIFLLTTIPASLSFPSHLRFAIRINYLWTDRIQYVCRTFRSDTANL